MNIPHDNANERFKAGFDSWMWISMMAAALVHFATFALWPTMTVSMDPKDPGTDTRIIPPLKVDIPDAPEKLTKPALPIMSSVDVPDDATIGVTSFDQNPVGLLPPPPTAGAQVVTRASTITPFTLPPRVLNTAEVVRALQREYPSILRNAGLGGTVNVMFSIDEEGRVLETSIVQRSSYEALDAAALAVADVIRFSPAQNRDQRVSVHVVFPIVFEVTGAGR